MAIRSCTGPDGKPGFQHSDDQEHEGGECHTYQRGDRAGQAKALRAAMRDANMEASGGDPRMARDG